MSQPYGLSLLSSYPDWWELFLLVAGASVAVTGGLYLLARRAKLLPVIRERDVHTSKKPRVGGVAMWLCVVGALVVLAQDPERFARLHFGGQIWLGLDRAVWGILAGLLVILVFGILDDLKDLRARTQLLGQFLAATAVVWGGIQAEYIRLPFQATLQLTGWGFDLPSWLGGGHVWALSALFTYFWVLAMINVMNFFDGLDGLAGSIAVTGSAVLFFVCLRLGLTGPATLALIVAGSACGFLAWNWHPAKLFMGTVGSQMLGFLLAVIAVISGAKVATAILVLGVPLLDAVVVVGRRLKAGERPFMADQRHLHHRLLKIGLPVPLVVVLTNLVALVFGVVALRTQDSEGKGVLALLLIGCMALFIAVTYWLERRKG